MSSSYTIENYSEKAIAVFSSNLGQYADALEALKGSRNQALRGPNETRRVGYVFPVSRRAEVEAVCSKIASGVAVDIAQLTAKSDSKRPRTATAAAAAATSSSAVIAASNVTSTTNHANKDASEALKLVKLLSSRVEALESEVAALRKQVGGKVPKISATVTKPSADDEDGEEDCDMNDNEEEEIEQETIKPVRKNFIARKKIIN